MENVQDLEEDSESDVLGSLPDQIKLSTDIMTNGKNSDAQLQTKDVNENSTSISGSESDFNSRSLNKSENFRVDKDSIPCVPKSEQDVELLDLGVSVYDQTEFENEVMSQVDKAMKAQEERKRVEDAQKEIHFVEEDIRFIKNRLTNIEKALSITPKDPNLLTNTARREVSAIKKEKEDKLKQMKRLEAKHKSLQMCISGNADEINFALQDNLEGNEKCDEETINHLKQIFIPEETEEERLIRTGEMTPFGTVISNNKSKPRNITIPQNSMTDFGRFLLTEAENHINKTRPKKIHHPKPSTPKPSTSTVVIRGDELSDFQGFTDLKAVPRKKHKHLSKVKLGSKHAKGFSKKSNLNRSLVKNYNSDSDISDIEMVGDKSGITDDVNNYSSDDVYIPGQDDSDDSDSDYKKDMEPRMKKSLKCSKTSRRVSTDSLSESDSLKATTSKNKYKKLVDDGNQAAFIKRIKALEKSEWIKKQLKKIENEATDSDEDDATEFEEGYRIPNSVWKKLYKYQQTAVHWLWELHQQNCGGILGDEMGLGKTIQVIAFLIGLKISNLNVPGDDFQGLGPVILVCPATVMHQWVKEFHTWWPYFRVAILHESGSFQGKKEFLIRNINKNHGILITSYAGVVQQQENLLQHEWHYVILDEGHKIRNPDAQATLAVKQIRTPHRIILSGSPVQNNLKELWSLFDFVFPGKLGTLPVFMQQFSVPIVLGGYANASDVQVQTAYKCATVLRDAIKPYLLRRMKSDVKMSVNLPSKSEQVLFCKLTEDQENLYKDYINSKEVGSILNSRLQVFVGLINLRKICNHPDIFDGGPKIFKDTDVSQLSEEEQYGYYKRAGKMIVVEALLRLWHRQGHRVLLFTQSRQMMEIFEIFVKSKNYTYMKMDGSTSISSRQPAVARFNEDPSIFVFLLTTRVGGLGVNLTGANRVILYDPDWNPSTDVQARERAWRIGQNKQVTIYRLLTAGTIEEKIYHRQIFKQFVTNRVLKDPKQKRFFKSNDLYELFTYQEVGPQGTETSAIFAGTGSEIKLKKKFLKQKKLPSKKESITLPEKSSKMPVSFSEEKREQMRMLAKKLSLELSKKIIDPQADTSKPIVQDSSKDNELNGSKDMSSSASKSVKKSPRDRSKEISTKKTRKRKTAEIDGEKIDFVVKKSVFKPCEDDEEKSLKQDDYVLSKLFKKSGVHTALKHDVIVEQSGPDYSIVENEANRVATEAIKALKESRQQCARASEGIPTWTGLHGGTKPRFGQKKRLPLGAGIASSSGQISLSSSKLCSKNVAFDGKNDNISTPSSSDLLSVIRNRKALFGSSERNSNSDDESMQASTSSISRPRTEHDELLTDIRNYIAFGSAVNGQASTKELLKVFKHKVPVSQTAIFKALLKRLCTFSKNSGEGIWYLKSEFQ